MERKTVNVGKAFAKWALPPRKPDGHKGDFGKAFLVGGSRAYTGAPYLMASSAVCSGCGLVYLGVPGGIWAVEASRCLSAIPVALGDADALTPDALPALLGQLEACDVLALGPGLGRFDGVADAVCEILSATPKPVVLDADGINVLSGHINILTERRGRVTILTPHDGEFARLLGDGATPETVANGDRIAMATDFAAQYGCILVLKGHRTITATPSGTALINTSGNSGLAKGGSGDVLTGLIASLLAQGATPVQASAGGVWIHGRAADYAAQNLTPYAMTPMDVIASFPLVFGELTEEE
ncbi:MAG: NAD(P)H-hydrate dehydratase [Oscillospiraceae bacterium]|nr:NAD(P)H-hydrate dehydratase [Oscillospiraceae bacterium]